MNEERVSRKILKWCSPEKRRKGRPRNSWIQKVTTRIRKQVITTWNGSTEKNEEKNSKFRLRDI